MKINEAKYTSRVNTGNYQHDEATISVCLNEEDSVEESLTNTRNLVYGWLRGDIKAARVVATSRKPVETKVEEKAEEKVEAAAPVDEKQEEKPKAKRGRKAAAKTEETKVEAKKEEVAEETPAEDCTIEMVRESFQELYSKKGKDIAMAVLEKFGTQKISELEVEKYADAIAEAKKAMA